MSNNTIRNLRALQVMARLNNATVDAMVISDFEKHSKLQHQTALYISAEWGFNYNWLTGGVMM